MLSMGDELWRTQRGNNNPYCHDSPLTWLDWGSEAEARAMLQFVQVLAKLRRDHPVFRRRDFLRGVVRPGGRAKDIVWLTPEGSEMGEEDWAAPKRAVIAFRLDGEAIESEPGRLGHDQSFIAMLNGEREAVAFSLPAAALGTRWRIVIDTRESARAGDTAEAGATVELEGGSAVVWMDANAAKAPSL